MLYKISSLEKSKLIITIMNCNGCNFYLPFGSRRGMSNEFRGSFLGSDSS